MTGVRFAPAIEQQDVLDFFIFVKFGEATLDLPTCRTTAAVAHCTVAVVIL